VTLAAPPPATVAIAYEHCDPVSLAAIGLLGSDRFV
jgi:hypothetical protein